MAFRIYISNGGCVIKYPVNIKLFDSLPELEDYLGKKTDIALISNKTPLLRDLDVAENIALILEYHNKNSIKKANQTVYEILKRCNIGFLGQKKVYELDSKSSIIVKYIRAYVSSFGTILIDRVFSMIDSMDDIGVVFELAEIFNDKTVELIDLKSNDYYKGKDVVQ